MDKSDKEKLEDVIDYIHGELVACDRAASWAEKQQHLENATKAALDGIDAYPRIANAEKSEH